MKEELVNFDTALLAREKGFSSGQYRRILYSTSSQRAFPAIGAGYDMSENVEAPTQALLQKWLREVHGIDVIALPWRDHADDLNDKHRYRPMIHKVKTYGEYERYEEALEVGLKKALELIKK